MDETRITQTETRPIDGATYPGLVTLGVASLQRTVEFYLQVIGLTDRPAGPDEAMLGPLHGEALVRLEPGAQPRARLTQSTGLYHMALLYPSRAALGAALLRLASSTYPIQGASDHGVSDAIYLADPEGNGIELYADRPKASWPRRGETLEMTLKPLDLEALMDEARAVGMEGRESVSELRMGHVHLHVAHLEPAVEFYRDGLGLNLIQRYAGQAAFLAAGDYHHHVGINTWAGVGAPQPPAASPGLRHFTLVLPSHGSLDSTLTQLRATGFPLRELDGVHQTQDPSGNRVNLVVSLPRDS
ncbi:MAG: hypothetical protein A2Z30_02810 [Chloroflexi bacterium RBG_16_64_43]|nr:MAG: hypothetical protein A2Z30_02810 [Chloroflexi bacterium RBG_16_64_43]